MAQDLRPLRTREGDFRPRKTPSGYGWNIRLVKVGGHVRRLLGVLVVFTVKDILDDSFRPSKSSEVDGYPKRSPKDNPQKSVSTRDTRDLIQTSGLS